jgi:hypothetical protein
MPGAPPVGGFQWRRMLGVMSGLVLLSVLTVGSYHVMNSTRFNNDGPAAKVSASKAGKHATGTGVGSGTSIATTTATTPVTASDNSSNGSGTAKSVATTNKKAIAKNSATAKAATSGRKANSTTGTQRTETGIARSEPKKANNVAASGTSTQNMNTPQGTDPMASATASLGFTNTPETTPNTASANGTAANNNNQSTSAVNSAKNVFAANTSAKPKPKARKVASGKASNNNMFAVAPVTPAADNTANPNRGPADPFRLKDSIQKMTIVQRFITNPYTRTGRFVNDTISVARMAVDRQVLNDLTGVSNAPQQRLASATIAKNNDIVPASGMSLNAAKADAGLSEEFVPLSNFKVHSRKTNAWDAQRFDEAVREAKFKLSQVRFYPGVSFGGSYLAGNNKIAGVQFGLFGLFTFGENWNAMGELKYVHRFNSGNTLQDNYYQIDTTGGATTPLQRKINHFFKFSTLQSIEMPLALRYAAGRINVFGGINLAYNFRVNAEEISSPADSAYTPAANPAWSNSSPVANYNDFGPRFSMGYLLGAGVEMTPALQLDLRMTQNVWDNGSGAGANLISRQLYRAPSFQVSLFYRFSQRNQIPKAK